MSCLSLSCSVAMRLVSGRPLLGAKWSDYRGQRVVVWAGSDQLLARRQWSGLAMVIESWWLWSVLLQLCRDCHPGAMWACVRRKRPRRSGTQLPLAGRAALGRPRGSPRKTACWWSCCWCRERAVRRKIAAGRRASKSLSPDVRLYATPQGLSLFVDSQAATGISG